MTMQQKFAKLDFSGFKTLLKGKQPAKRVIRTNDRRKGLKVADLNESQLHQVWEARTVSGMSWSAIEQAFGLKPTSGMTAYNAVLKVDRLKKQK